MTYREALRAGRTHLLEAGVPDADLDAWYLLEFIRKRAGLPGDRTWFLMNDREEMPIRKQRTTGSCWIGGQSGFPCSI